MSEGKPTAPAEDSTRRRWLQLALVVLPCLAFAPGLTSPFTHYDDPLYLDRPELTVPGWAGLLGVWSGQSAWTGHFVEFFPLRDTVYWLLVQLWGKAPLPFHLASLALHLVATQLVFRFSQQLGVTSWVAAATALLFAVHPIHIESVVWAAGLKDPLYTCFVLGSLTLFLSHREQPRPARYLGSLALLTLGLLVKSMALSTPLIMLALERFVGRPTAWKTALLRVSGPALLCALFLQQYLAIASLNAVRTTLHQGNLVAHVVLASWAQAAYVRQLFFPATFRLIYCFAPVNSWFDVRFFIGCAVLGAAGAAAVFWRRRPVVPLGLVIYFACLFPVSNLLPFSAVMADRYLYMASIGGLLLLSALLDTARERLKNPVLLTLVVALAFTTALRSAIWQDEELLWQEGDEDPVCAKDPEFPAADIHFLRSLTAKHPADKVAALERLLSKPGPRGDNFGLRCEASLTGARVLMEQGEADRAAGWLARAVGCEGSHPHQLAQATLLVMLHRDLPRAAAAAARWHELLPSPETKLFMLLTRLELQEDPETREGVERLMVSSPHICGLLREWAGEVDASQRQKTSGALSFCTAH